MAVWMYMPSIESFREEEKFYCDNHISRGCSCNIIHDEEGSFEEYKDELGRLLPCCEYDYSKIGFSND